MLFCFADQPSDDTKSITPLTRDGFAAWRREQPADMADHIERVGFAAKPGQIAWLPDASGVLVGLGDGS
ncbi:MAG: leucyl aminopeptidase family protein, partial [Pseudomonadota bacterium]